MEAKDVHNAILLIPGLGGSVLYAKIKNKNGTETEELIWPKLVNADFTLHRYMNCYIDKNTLRAVPYDDNVRIYATDKDYGLYGIDFLIHPIEQLSFYPQFHYLIDMFEKCGYQRGVSLWGYPYDFFQEISQPCIMLPLRDRIIEAFNSCGQKKISIISHSQGGLLFKTFAALYPDDVSKYVRRWITIGTPFQGAAVINAAMMFGYNFGFPCSLLLPRTMQIIQRLIPLSFWYFPQKNFPLSSKVGIKYAGQTQITWYGTHNDQENKCWDYDSIDVQYDEQQNQNNSDIDEEYELLSRIIDGKIQLKPFIIAHTHFSKNVLDKYERLNPSIIDYQDEIEINQELQDKRNLYQHFRYMSQISYKQCKCGGSYGLIRQSPSSNDYQYTQRFSYSFLENRKRDNMQPIFPYQSEQQAQSVTQQYPIEDQDNQNIQKNQEQQQSSNSITSQSSISSSSSSSSQSSYSSFSPIFQSITPSYSSIPQQDEQISNNQLTPNEYMNLPMFNPSPLHQMFKPGYALVGLQNHYNNDQQINQQDEQEIDFYNQSQQQQLQSISSDSEQMQQSPISQQNQNSPSQSEFFHIHQFNNIDLPKYEGNIYVDKNQNKKHRKKKKKDIPIEINTVDKIIRWINPMNLINHMAHWFTNSFENQIPCKQYLKENVDLQPPHLNQKSFFELIREIQHWQNENERIQQQLIGFNTEQYNNKQLTSNTNTSSSQSSINNLNTSSQSSINNLNSRSQSQINIFQDLRASSYASLMSSQSSSSVALLNPYIPPSQGGKATLWDVPSLEQIQAHVEQIRSLPVVFPPEGEFEFINIYGSGYATAWHLILLAYQGLNKGDNKAFTISSPEDLSQYCDYMSEGKPQIQIASNKKIKKIIKKQQNRKSISPSPSKSQLLSITSSSQSNRNRSLSPNPTQSILPQYQEPQVSYSLIKPNWTIVDGDGTVPCCSSSVDEMRADARFEIRGQQHMYLLWDYRLLNLIAAIFGLWNNENNQGIKPFKPYKCNYLNEYERISNNQSIKTKPQKVQNLQRHPTAYNDISLNQVGLSIYKNEEDEQRIKMQSEEQEYLINLNNEQEYLINLNNEQENLNNQNNEQENLKKIQQDEMRQKFISRLKNQTNEKEKLIFDFLSKKYEEREKDLKEQKQKEVK